MKTQIIRIETHDDAISIKDKMGWGQTPRILLVWPEKERLLRRRLDLVALKRHAATLSAQLAFVSKDTEVRYHARNLGIPVYPNIRKAEKSHWRRPRSRTRPDYKSLRAPRRRADLDTLRKIVHPDPRPWLVHPITRLVFFTLGVSGILAIALIFVPSATIRLTPNSSWDTITFPVSASLQADSRGLAGSVPIQVRSVIVEGRDSLQTTGVVTIPDKSSQGKVVFTNMTEDSITVPAGLIASTLGNNLVRFTTLETVVVAAGTKSELIPVEAVIPGSRGNVLSNHILAIEGPLGLELTVTNPIGTSHGSDQTSAAPREKDFQDLSAKLLSNLHNSAKEEISSLLAPHDLLLWMDPQDYEILEETFIPAEIQPADKLILLLRVAYQAYVVPAEPLESLGEGILEANLAEGYAPVRSSLQIEHIQAPLQLGEDRFSWVMAGKWKTTAVVDEAEAKQMVLWRKPAEAEQQLQDNLDIHEDVSISIIPAWWPRLPILPFRIDLVNLQNANVSP